MAAANAAGCKTLQEIFLLPSPLKILGRGAYGTVYQKGDYVLKKISTRKLNVSRQTRQEIQTLKELQAIPALRKYLPHFCGSYSERGTSWIIQKYKPVKDLHAVLESQRAAGTLLPFELGHGLAQNLIKGLDALHRAGYLHRDLKPENILVRMDLPPGHLLEAVPLFIDFGFACRAPCRETRRVGTYAFTPQNWWHPTVRNEARTARGKTIRVQQERLDPAYSRVTDNYALAQVLTELAAGTDFTGHADERAALQEEIAKRRARQTGSLVAQIALRRGLAPPPDETHPPELPASLPAPPVPRGVAASPWTMESILQLVRWKPPTAVAKASGPSL